MSSSSSPPYLAADGSRQQESHGEEEKVETEAHQQNKDGTIGIIDDNKVTAPANTTSSTESSSTTTTNRRRTSADDAKQQRSSEDEEGGEFALLETERLVAFTDASVAIAMTLLILPLMDASSDAEDISVAEFFTEHRDKIGSFVLSFWIVGILWAPHDMLFRHVRAHTVTLRGLNFLWLFCVVCIPVATNIAKFASPSDLLAYVTYIGTMLLARIISGIMLLVVMKDARTWKHPQRGPKQIDLVKAGDDVLLFVTALIIGVTAETYLGLLILMSSNIMVRVATRKWPSLSK
jgi:uncharacterized membrane protein